MFWIIAIAVNILIAWTNDLIRRDAIKKHIVRSIHHGWWAFLYTGLCMIPYLIDKNWFEVASVLPLHISVFPVFFNWFSDKTLSPFRLSRTSTAISDRFMVWIGLKSAEGVNIAGFILSAGLMIYYYIKF